MPLFSAATTDLPFIADLVNSAYRGEASKQGWTHESDYVTGDRTSAEALNADLAAAPNAQLLMFKDKPEAEMLGCVWLEPAADAVWYLGMLTVRPNLQARQLGRTILEGAESIAAHHGARRIRMTVVNVRDTLIAWYERRGYAITGETQPFPYEDAPFGTPNRDDLCFVVLEKTL